jgi:hypothetical protein
VASRDRFGVRVVAPTAVEFTEYDRAHLLTYARVLDAADGDADWREAAAVILGCDVAQDSVGAETCWTSHLERARWVLGEGLVRVVVPES